MSEDNQLDQQVNELSPDTQDEYARYFNQVSNAFSKLLACYPSGTHNYETESIRGYLIKLLYSIQVLRKKHTFNPAHSLRVDLTDSGFPQFLEFSYFDVDLLTRKDRLIALPPMPMLKQAMLDYMFRHQEEPKDLLWQLSEREYFELLDSNKLFLSFTPGKCELQSEERGRRNYLFSWGCFDFVSNRPYIHIMTFEQDTNAEPLHAGGANWHQFLEVIRAEGSRVPELAVLAVSIDSDLEPIHPKVIKRICVGPLHSQITCVGGDHLCDILTSATIRSDDFILLMKHETLFSQKQTVLEAGLLTPRRVREIFYIPETDLDCYEHKASVIHRYMLMPHRVLQELHSGKLAPEYEAYRKLTFGTEGQVHGV